MDSKYPSAPELPGKHTGHYDTEPEAPAEEAAGEAKAEAPKIQLIQSTKPKQDEDDTAETSDDSEVYMLDDEDELNEHVAAPGDPDGVVANDQIKQWQQEHPLPVTKPKRRKPFWLKAIVTLLVIAALAAGAWWYGGKKAEAPSPKATRNTQAQKQIATTPATTTKHYDSDTYTLGFDYPSDWVVSDTAAKLTVTSPVMQLTGADGKKVQGNVVLAMQSQQTTITGYPAGGASAALDSTKLTYKKPTQIQRAQTYLSYLSYKGSGLDALYVMGDYGYQSGQNVPLGDVVKGNPLISVNFINCGTAGCAQGGSALTLQASTWQNSQAGKDITALLESLQLN